MFSLLAYYALGNAPTQHNTRNFFENLGPSPSIRPPDNCSLVKMGNQASSLAIVLNMNCYVMLYKVQKTILKFRNFSKFDLCPKCLQIDASSHFGPSTAFINRELFTTNAILS